MRPALDPRVGNQRQKQLLQKIAQMAMQRKGYTQALSKFGKYGNGVSARTGPLRAAGTSRVGGTFKGFGSLGAATPKSVAQMFAAAQAQQALDQAPGQQGQGQGPPYSPGDVIPPAEVGSNPFVTGQPGGAGQGGTATSDPEHNAYLGGYSDVDPFGGFASNTQSAPAAPIEGAGGLIPLGGGIYYDPETGALHGGGLTSVSLFGGSGPGAGYAPPGRVL